MKKILLSIFFLLLFCSQCYAATIVAATGAAGNWTAGSAWVGGVAPTAADDAQITATTTSITIDNGAVAKSVDFTGFTGTATHNANATIIVSGSITLAAGMTYTHSATSILAMNGTGTLTTNGITVGQFQINIGGAMTLGNNVTANGSAITKSASGTFTANGKTVELTGVGSVTLAGSGWSFYNLTRTGNAALTDSLLLAANITVTNTFTLTGNSALNRLFTASNTLGTTRTITNSGATMTWSNVDFQDITLGTAYDASAISGGSGNCGGNTNITFTTATNPWYFKATTNNGTANNYNWSENDNWYTATNGGGSQMGATVVPLAQDNFVFDSSSIPSASNIVKANMARLGSDITFNGVTNTPTFNIPSITTMFGSLDLTGTTMTGTSIFRFEGRVGENLTTGGVTITAAMQNRMFGSTLTLQDAFTSSTSFTNFTGTFTTGGYSVTITSYTNSSVSSTLTPSSSTITLTGNGSVWSFANGTLTANTSTIKFTDTTANAVNFISGGKATYNIVWFARGASIGNNTTAGSPTLVQLKDTGTAAHNLMFQNGQTVTLTDPTTPFVATGSSGNVITINTTTGTATHALTISGGAIVSCDWLNIQHSVASPANTWYAGANSTNNQSVATAGSGWIFTAPPSGRSRFIMVN